MPSCIAATEPLPAAQTIERYVRSSFAAFLSVKKSIRSLLSKGENFFWKKILENICFFVLKNKIGYAILIKAYVFAIPDFRKTEVTDTDRFKLISPYAPTGDQPEAIEALTRGVLRGDREQSLVGVTGSGKTFTMANIIANCNRPTLVLAHNKTLAAQLCSEFREFFPENAV